MTQLPSILHVMNGHSMIPIVAAAQLPGTMTIYADALHEGPVPGGLGDAEMREVRGRFLASPDQSWQAIAHSFGETDAAIVEAQRQGEVVFWFEHDLFDQLLLIRHLARLDDDTRPHTSLVCIDRFPGIEPFLGLGQLSGPQLASLFPARVAVSAAQADLARRAWHAFTAPEPTAISALLAAGMDALPFLRAALLRHLQEFPSIATGLPATEQGILEILAAGPLAPSALFRAAQRRETCFFIGDTSFRDRLDRLAAGPQPLVQLQFDAAGILPPGLVSITGDGRDVLAGRVDWLMIQRFDRWLGGVHVTPGSAWRRDGDQVRAV